MKRIHGKLSVGLLGAALAAGAAPAACGSDEEAGAGASGSAGSDGSAGSSGDAGSGGSAGSSGDAGTSGSSGTNGASGAAGSSSEDAAADSAGDVATDGGCNACSAYSTPSSSGNVASALIAELSGIAASRAHPGVFYAHNDSGDSARFFAFDASGNTIGEFVLQGITAVDWEDVALGPCPAGSCLFFGDIGDNNQQRSSVAVIRVAEPDVAVGASVGTVNVTHDRFEYSYAPGPQNAETLLIHPLTGNLYIVTKSSSGTSLVFRIDAPTSPGAGQTLQTLVSLPLPTPGGRLATGGAIHPCGDRLLIRTYDALLEYTASSTAAFESAFAAMPQSVPVATEPQGEAVTYLHDGRGYVTASEGRSPPLNASRCQ